MKARIPQERQILKFDDIDKAKSAMLSTWNRMRDELKNGTFSYRDVSEAKNSTFLSVFNDLFKVNEGYRFFEVDLQSVFNQFHIVRGTVIKEGESSINYERLLPKSEFITEDNRFSPKGVEWLYLAVGSPKSCDGLKKAKYCSQAECRAIIGNKFAICSFDLATSDNIKIVDLTIANQWTYNKLQKDLEHAAERIVRQEANKFLKTCSQPSTSAFIPEFLKWLVYTYAKMLSEQIFVPVETNNKELVYAPFHCMAQYFISLGYSGIIYKSTVFDEGKNLVLFDKNLAKPVGNIELYTV